MRDDFGSLAYSRYQPEPEAGRQQLSRAARRGVMERVSRGAYMSAEEWSALNPRDQYLARITAVIATRKVRPVLSHFTAAAIHGLPILGQWPLAVHATVLPTIGTHSRASLTKHVARIPDEDVVYVDDILVTSIARTVIDLAASTSFMSGVVTADAALYSDPRHHRVPLTTKRELNEALERALPLRAHARTSDVVAFAESKAQTPIESVSRVNMRVFRAPRPELQVPHYDAAGFIGDTDFAWEAFGAVGEADGDLKYLDASAREGRTANQVFLDEKRREDRLRALPRKVGRWPWAVAVDPIRLRDKLKQLGLPLNVTWDSAVL